MQIGGGPAGRKKNFAAARACAVAGRGRDRQTLVAEQPGRFVRAAEHAVRFGRKGHNPALCAYAQEVYGQVQTGTILVEQSPQPLGIGRQIHKQLL